jgi:hypothetical protein
LGGERVINQSSTALGEKQSCAAAQEKTYSDATRTTRKSTPTFTLGTESRQTCHCAEVPSSATEPDDQK